MFDLYFPDLIASMAEAERSSSSSSSSSSRRISLRPNSARSRLSAADDLEVIRSATNAAAADYRDYRAMRQVMASRLRHESAQNHQRLFGGAAGGDLFGVSGIPDDRFVSKMTGFAK